MEVDKFTGFLRDLSDLDAFNTFVDINMVQRRYCYIKPPSLPKTRKKRFNPSELSDYEFKQKYRFTKENINKIVEIVRDDLELERPAGNNQVPIQVQVLIAIRKWGLDEVHTNYKNLAEFLPELLAETHTITVHTLDKICRRVAAALASKASRYIRMPATLAEKEQVTQNFYTIAGFPQVIGAVSSDSFRIRKVIKSDETLNNVSECSINIQIISDASLKIRDFDYRVHPTSKSFIKSKQIFPETRIKERFEQHEFRGRLLLGDSTYTCTNYLYTPVLLLRNASLKEMLFNKSHTDTHAPVKLCQQFLQKRFNILQSEIVCSSFSGAKHLFVALAVLHNIGIELGDSCSEFTDVFGPIYAETSKYFNNREDTMEDSGADSRCSFISKNF